VYFGVGEPTFLQMIGTIHSGTGHDQIHYEGK
jgi:hypothetical protein